MDTILSSLQNLHAGLLALIIKSSFILLITFGIISLMKKFSASARHLVWTVALVAVILLPVIPALTPQWQVPLLPDPAALRSGEKEIPELDTKFSATEKEGESSLAAIPTQPNEIAPGKVVTKKANEDYLEPLQKNLQIPLLGSHSGQSKGAEADSVTQEPFDLILPLLIVWAGGVVVTFFWLLSGILSVSKAIRKASPIICQGWHRDLETVRGKYNITSAIQLVYSEQFDYPLVFGIFRPKLVIPLNDLQRSDIYRKIVLLHELAHIKRRDTLTQLLVHFALPLNWFNPLAWMAVNNLLREQELSCDDYVLTSQIKPADYAAQLLEITETMKGRTNWAVASMANKSEIKGRIMDILNPEKNRRITGKLFSTLLVLIGLSLILPLASAQMWSNESAGTTKEAEKVEPLLEYSELFQDDDEDGPQVRKKFEDLNFENLIEELNSSDPYVTAKAAFYLGAFKNKSAEALPRLIELLGDDRKVKINFVYQYPGSDDSFMMWKGTGTPGNLAAQAIKAIGLKNVDQLLPSLKGGNDHARYNSLKIIAKMEGNDAHDAIASAVGDSSVEVRLLAVKSLRKMKNKKYLPVIGSRINDPDKDVRQYAVKTLKEFKDEACIPYLSKTVNDSDQEVRLYALRALQEIDTEEARLVAIPFLKDTDNDVRNRAIRVLRESDNPKVLSLLKESLSDLDEENRLLVLKTLMNSPGKNLIPFLKNMNQDKSRDVRYYAVKTLREINDPGTLTALAGFLSDEDKSIRSTTIRALRDLQNTSAIPFLTEASRTEEDPELRSYINKTITKLEKK